ncbi:hypothetical protein [Nonomuraea sp. NPDC003214]
MATLADRLDEGLRSAKLSERAAARALAKVGVKATHAYIGQLRKGTKTNPTLEFLAGMAAVLGVTVGWLTGEDPPPAQLSPEEEQQLAQVRQGLEELGVEHVAQRMTGLSPLSMSAIAQMVEAMRAAEELDRQREREGEEL